MKKKIVLAIIMFVMLLSSLLVWEISKPKKIIAIYDYGVLHDEKFGGIYIDISIEDFNKIGFDFGDSVNVSLSNNVEIRDIPYYNGYYVDVGDIQMVGYPGYSYVKLCVNNGEDLWTKYYVDESIKASVVVNEKAKYLNMQEARDIHYTDIQGNIPDIVFANFRNVKVGKMKENILYRSASPVDNSHNRAPVTDRLIKNSGINYIVNLSDNDDELINHINKTDFNSPYFLSLYNEKKVIALSMNMQFKSNEFNQKLIHGLEAMSEHDGPYLIHCVEGKDRTGYFVMILSGLMGASYQELIDDYMKTYENYYDISKDKDIEKYNIIKEKNIDEMLKYVTNSEKLDNINYEDAIENYLISIGMSKDKISKLKNHLK